MKKLLARLFGPAMPAPAVHNPALPPLAFHNTLSGDLEKFVPLSRRDVKIYNCGPTVYDRVHIGNLRSYIFADLVYRTLAYWEYNVQQVINITDVGHLTGDNEGDADTGEDKMEKSAKQKGRSAQDIAHEVTQWFFEDLDALGVDRSHIAFPRATEYIHEQIVLVQALMEKGYAYKLKDGIYYDTSRFPSYGKLGGIKLSQLKEGARVEENKQKRNPYDFALWKFSPKNAKRQQEWDSPWGKGFPGWHIECTAMIFTLLGKQIDIHTGGVDHIPVHHNNEIAQAEAVTGKRYVKYWMHNEFITIDGKKISKSLHNTVYLYQIVERGLSPRSLRYLYLSAKYRSPINFTWEAIQGADAAYRRLAHVYAQGVEAGYDVPDKKFLDDFLAAIANDLDTPKAMARMWDMVRDESLSPARKAASLREADKILGLGFSQAAEATKLAVLTEEELPEEVRSLVSEREEARAAKDFAKADLLRDKLKEAGFEVKDTPEGPQITRI